MKSLALAGAALLLASAAQAQLKDPPPAAGDRPATAEEFEARLKPQHGEIKLPNGVATLELSDDFYYLSPSDAEYLLSVGWGNPPGSKTLGMILPQGISPVRRGAWGVTIHYLDDGHVSDDDAAKIDYTKMLSDMQAAEPAINQKRQQGGYPPLHFVGWAAPPYYDAQTHKLYWAKELKIGDAGEDTLNYDIRVLGRKGVLELDAIAGVDQLDLIKAQMPKVLAFTNFDQGSRYIDFNPSTDKVAAYGLAALVAGGIAAKVGLFAKLGLLLLAAKKFIVIGLAAVVAFFRKLFGRGPKPGAPPGGPGPAG
jgi:uncharacterized membrane-anchored protein